MKLGAALMHAAAMACLLLVSAAAPAQEWPRNPIRIIVPFPPGQGADIIGRLLAERLTPVLGQQIRRRQSSRRRQHGRHSARR